MTHDELLARISLAMPKDNSDVYVEDVVAALRAVVEFHKPMEENDDLCLGCWSGEGIMFYPCPTIKDIHKALQ